MLAENEIAAQIARQQLLQEIEQRKMAPSPASVNRDYRAVAKSAMFGAVLVGTATIPATFGFQSSPGVMQAPATIYGRKVIAEIEAGRSTLERFQSPLELFLNEKVRDAHAAAKGLAQSNPLFEDYAIRLGELIDLARDEYPETDIPSPASIKAFAKMLSAFSQLRAPSLSLLPSGALWLSWKKAQHGTGGMAIFRDGTASFAMLLDNPERPTRPIHVNVSGDLKSVLATMADTASSRWIGEFT